MKYIENKTFDEIEVGDSAEVTRTLKSEDIEHGMWGGALFSAVLGIEMPGPGTTYLNRSLKFRRPLGFGDAVTVRVTVTAKDAMTKRIMFDCLCIDQDGETAVEGQAEVIAPTRKIRRPRIDMPEAQFHERGARYRDLIAAAAALTPVRTAVVHPCDALSLTGALDAASENLIVPILVGPRARIESAAAEIGRSLDGIEIVDVPHSHAAAASAVGLVREGKADALMKGKLHTDELMEPVVHRDTGLRTERRMSHVFALDVPHYAKPLFITDAAINIFPDLDTKRDIVQNAIDLVQSLGVACPKVAILSAVETVYSKIPSTIEAAALCKMLDRAQITGGLLDGPLAFDNAVSKSAAEAKGIVSEVAGDADILVAPDMQSGNMIAKQLIHLAGAEAAGIVMGARVPIVLTSRADGVMSRLASTAMALLYVHHAQKTAL